MPELSSSERRLFKATYAPIIVPEAGGLRPGSRALAKAAFVAALAVRPSEVPDLQAQVERSGGPADAARAVEIISQIASDITPSASYNHAVDLKDVDAEALLHVGRILAEERAHFAATLQAVITTIREQYRGWAFQPDSSPDRPQAIQTETDSTPPASIGSPQPVVSHSIEVRDPRGRRLRLTHERRVAGSVGELVMRAEPIADVLQGGPLPREASRPLVGTIEDAIAWASQNNPSQVQALRKLTEERAPVPLDYSNVGAARALSYVIPKLAGAAQATLAAVHAFSEHMKIEPVGRLHLERLDMTPVGVERGELLSSIPLAPKETVNISHREWSVTTKEFESIVQDSFEGYSEQGVSEKTEVAQSTENQSRHSSALSFGASATASYMGVTLSSSLGYQSSSSDEHAQKDSRNHSISITRKASARVKKDHKTSFRVSSVAGTEDRAVRVITNPSETDSMRVDYYQLMRKWRVDLYRYGLRLTYDLAIPSPGADLMRKFKDLAAIDEQLNQPFEFTLNVTDITRDNWQLLAELYQATIDAPPLAKQDLMAFATIQQSTDDNDKFFVGSIDLDVDTNYELTAGIVISRYYIQDAPDDQVLFDVLFDANPAVTSALFPDYPHAPLKGEVLGRNGHLSIPYFHRGVVAASINVAYEITLRNEVFEAWQSQVWAALRAGAEAVYKARVSQLNDQRAALVADLAPFDALTLRQMELEEIMKGALRWLFGPAFKLAPQNIQDILGEMAANDPLNSDALDPSVLSNQQWQRMMEFGEFIKYVQQAIEWENVLYFPYPYFWDTPKNWTIKQLLEHPDALHRTFLRAGSARVVLTIRPGFEESFTALIETGVFGQLPGDHPYVSIAQEIEDYANTHYPGIPPANPDNPPSENAVNQGERGELIATWWEYTPTSALDLSLNTALAEMA